MKMRLITVFLIVLAVAAGPAFWIDGTRAGAKTE